MGADVDLRLADVPNGKAVRIVALSFDAPTAAWLSAIGIGCGECVTVLRRALFSGPLHVRTETGAELAIGHALSRDIQVERVDD
ncbi:MAG: FeoA family protein [Polyangiaceae bacterium]